MVLKGVEALNITERLIKNYSDELVYKKGEELYQHGKVIDIEVTSENSTFYNFKIYKIDAWVDSGDKDEYNAEIIFNDRSGFMNVKCDCEGLYNTSVNKTFCQHVVAVLLKYAKESANPQVKNLNSVRAERLVRELKNNMAADSDIKRELNLEVRYCYDKINPITSSLEFRLGFERLYMIKEIKDFLRAVETGEDLEFGKGFTFKPSQHKFRQKDMGIVELLLENYEIEAKSSTSTTGSLFSYGIKLFSGKKAFILDKQLHRFFDIIRDISIEATIQGVDYNGLNIICQDMPLEFEARMNKESIVILHKSDIPRPINSDGTYYFYKGNIYIPGSEQLKLYAPFYNAFISEKSYHITFNKEDGDKVASYIVPSLRSIGRSVELDENLRSSLYEEDLKVKVYLDKEEQAVSARVIFSYGDTEIEGFQENHNKSKNGMLVRDIKRELKVSNLLKEFGFLEAQNKYMLFEEENLVNFLSQGIKKFQEIAEVYYSDSFKTIKLYGTSSYRSSITLNNEDLLEFSFSIEGIDREELKNIFKALKEKKKYYKLKKGTLVSLEDEGIRNIGSLIEYLNVKDLELLKDTMVFSRHNAFYIDEILKQSKISYVKSNGAFRELINNIRNVQDVEYTLPQHLDTVMRGYQKIGFKWFKTLSRYGFGGILADEMGLGKTLQTIAFIVSEIGQGTSLVVAPTSLVYNWKSEIEKFAPELKTVVVSGNKYEREELRKHIEECDVVITSYPLIRRDIEAYKEINFRYCILDEAQQIKNPSSMNASSVKEIKAKGYFALTGTPIENSLTELWSIFDFIMPGYLMSHGRFSQKFETPIVKNKDEDSLEQLNLKIKPFILRRFKKDVLNELPPKIEQKLVVEMTEDQKKLYAAYLAEAKQEINSEIRDRGFNRSAIKILSVLTRLRQICCDPSVFLENYKGDSGKMQALDEMLEEIISAGHRVLLFSQFTTVLKNIAKRLKSNDIEYMYLDGSTKTEERVRLVKEFNEGKSSIFLISLKAGGTGLNLTGADMVIHFDPWWNPAVEDQATDRAHRIGQNKTVEVIKLIAQGTIEEKIQRLQEKKKHIIKNVIDGNVNEDNIISQMTQEEIEELFSMY
jgi:SNF2 family DNA or RNA helicase